MAAQKIHTFLIEDDALMRDIVRQYIALSPHLHLVGEATDHPTALQRLNASDERVDLIISDVETKLINGIEFFKALNKQPLIIFITSHPEYAVEGFEVKAVDFLLKPFGFPRFQKAIERVEQELQRMHNEAQAPTLPPQSDDNFTYLRSENQYVKIVYADVLYVEGLKDYCRIVMSNGAQHITWINLKGIEEQFPAKLFMRVHKSYIVNKDHIQAVGNDVLKVGNAEIPLGHTYKEAIMNDINRHTTKR